jgi:hypothetical protein
MTERTCETCKHGGVIIRPEWPRGALRCMRLAKLRNGDTDNHMGVGRDRHAERASWGETHRARGDKCGPDGRNWEQK